jgi:hypothetical protein
MAGGATPPQPSAHESAGNFVAREDLEQVSGALVHPIEAHGNAPVPASAPAPSNDSVPELRPPAPSPEPQNGDPSEQ